MIEHVDGAVAEQRAAVAGGAGAGSAAVTDPPVVAPAAGWASGPLGAVQAADREIARQTALRARAVAAFAASRPASADRVQGEKGAMSAQRWAARPELLRPVSEWAANELAIALAVSGQAAEALLERSLTLVGRLPGTLAALEAGGLHVGHLWPLLEHVGCIAEEATRAEVEAVLLGWVAGRAARRVVTTPAQLGAKARRVTLARGARAAADRLARALKERGVHLQAERAAGMASVTAVVSMPEAQALVAALGAYADAVEDEPGAAARSRGQKMADCLLDLVLRPGAGARPPVQVALTVVAGVGTLLGGDAPGEVEGQVVPAEVVRALLRAVTGAELGAAALAEYAATAAANADAEPADAEVAAAGADHSAATATAGPTPEAVESAERSWQELEQQLAAWGAEIDRRLLAGELAGEPDPIPDAVLAAWAAEGLDPASGSAGAAEPDPAPEAFLPDKPPASLPEEEPPPDGGGWWAAADRAVDDAARAALRAQQALGHARRIVRTAARADAADTATWAASPAGRVSAADDALGALAAAAEADRAVLAALLAATAGGGLADRPRLALTDALSGALLALTDLPELRRVGSCGAPGCRRRPQRCTHDLAGRPGLGPPGPTDAYRPYAALDRFLRARDRRCRFPGCRRRVPRTGELDHDTPYPDGPTAASNLAGYCTADHRGKHQAPGWTHTLAPDATLTVTTPTGLTAVTTPPPY